MKRFSQKPENIAKWHDGNYYVTINTTVCLRFGSKVAAQSFAADSAALLWQKTVAVNELFGQIFAEHRRVWLSLGTAYGASARCYAYARALHRRMVAVGDCLENAFGPGAGLGRSWQCVCLAADHLQQIALLLRHRHFEARDRANVHSLEYYIHALELVLYELSQYGANEANCVAPPLATRPKCATIAETLAYLGEPKLSAF